MKSAAPTTPLDPAATRAKPQWLVALAYPLLLIGGAAALGLCLQAELAVVLLLEKIAPAQAPAISSGEVKVDLLHTLATIVTSQTAGFLITAAGLGASVASLGWLSEVLGLSLWPHGWPLVLQLGLALLVGELGTYTLHRACHRFPFLWRIHAVHHTPEQLYIVAAGRNHPIQAVLNYSLQTLPVVLLGADPAVIALYAAFTAVNGLFQHANLHVPAGYLSWLVATPSLHRTHHSLDLHEGNTNFGNNLILWDLVFGTRHIAPEPSAFGIADEFPEDYLGQVMWSFRSRSEAASTEQAQADPALLTPVTPVDR